ncbi:MAG: helix-turn-helix domain-containing protein [Pseudomonadales bacterium]|nr:helix-turn-helix domain-containing protein [Pseudomonadales bacterium]
MELQIDAEKIKALRTARAWSQEHLAEVAGLGRRTIQRVENSGTASYETAQAIAAVLELDVAEITTHKALADDASRERNRLLRKISVALTSLAVFALFAISRSVTADQVQLNIEALVNEEHQTVASTIMEEGKVREFQLEGDYRVSVTPSVTNEGNIRLELVMMKLTGEEYEQVGTPILYTPDGQPALIVSADDDGQRLTLEITPSLI